MGIAGGGSLPLSCSFTLTALSKFFFPPFNHNSYENVSYFYVEILVEKLTVLLLVIFKCFSEYYDGPHLVTPHPKKKTGCNIYEGHSLFL